MKLSLILILLSFSLLAFSQDKVLPVDESGKYTFMSVTELNTVTKSQMAANVKRFFKNNPKSLKMDAGEQDSIFTGKGKMIVLKGTAGIGHPSAEVNYTVSIAVRQGRYRLILTDFVVTPYERDRYGNFVPVSVSSPLERSPDKLSRSEWDRNMAFVYTESGKIADKLKAAMSNTQPETRQESKKPATISTKEW